MKFDPDAVLAALAESPRPMTTREVHKACCKNAGMPAYLGGNHQPVIGALEALTRDGQAVTATRYEIANPDRHIVTYHDGSRYWATPETSARVKAANDARDRVQSEAATLAGQLHDAWKDLIGQGCVGVQTQPDGGVRFDMDKTAAEMLLAVLRDHTER